MNLSPQQTDLDLLSAQMIYFVGIKGVGMTALAVLLHEAGVQVQGADVDESFVTDATLAENNILVEAFAEARIPENTSFVIYSGAHNGSKQRLVRDAADRGIPCLNLAQAVGIVSQQKTTVAICGVGGKSTTSAMLSWILESAGHLPSYAVGVGTIPNLGSPARWQTEGEFFVIEADEYVADPQSPPENRTPRFLYLSPTHAICTSLAYDHPDVYASFADTQAAFRALFAKLPIGGKLVINGDQSELVQLAAEFSSILEIISVGESEHCAICLQNVRVENGVGLGELQFPSGELQLSLPIPGFHNLKDAAYAATMAASLGVALQDIQAAIASFRSTTRRFELIGITPEGMWCYDDYAHHPRELLAIAETLTEWFPEQKVAVAFQPHTYSRTKALLEEFVQALGKMPAEVVLLPIFSSAREQPDETVSSELLAEELQRLGKQVRSLQSQAELLEYLQRFSEQGNVFVTLGAGDIYKVYEQLTFRSTQ